MTQRVYKTSTIESAENKSLHWLNAFAVILTEF